MLTTVQKAAIPSGRRILALSDIHGGRAQLRDALRKAAFTTDDILFIVGDYIERGPENLGVLRDVMGLCETHTVYPLIGNVDLSRLNVFENGDLKRCRDLWDVSLTLKKNRGQALLWEMCEETGVLPSSPEELVQLIPMLRRKFQPELDFLRRLPTIVEAGPYIFVHGGIPSEDLSSFTGTEPYQYLKNDNFVRKGFSFDRWVVVGHWPACLYGDKALSFMPYVSEAQQIISIDGGCGVKSCGQVNVVELPPEGGAPTRVYYADSLPVVKALDAQSPADGAALITWITRQVEPLRQEEDFSFVRHLKSGRELWIPSSIVFEYEGETCAEDYADNRLEVSPGDELGVVLRTSRGLLAKKDGLVGWYSGRYVGVE